MTLRIPGRVAFLVPWPRHWIVGTTDKPHHGPVDRIAATAEDVDEILGTLNGALDLELTRADLVGTYAGLRPLIAPSDASSTVRVSREHRVSVEAPGLVRVSGGKYTTYRVMARDAVDAIARRRRPCSARAATRQLPIHGAAARTDLDRLAARLAADDGLTHDQATSLVDRHGTDAEAVLALGREHDLVRTTHRRRAVPRGRGRVGRGARAWRSRSTTCSPAGCASSTCCPIAARPSRAGSRPSPGHVLGWDEARRAREVDTFLEGARREFGIPGD